MLIFHITTSRSINLADTPEPPTDVYNAHIYARFLRNDGVRNIPSISPTVTHSQGARQI